jgi:serine/threonine protein phosphatase PrpC
MNPCFLLGNPNKHH